jgi:hypothetical protein
MSDENETSTSAEIVPVRVGGGANFYPSALTPNPAYVRFVEVRERLLTVVRSGDAATVVINDIADALLDADPEMPASVFGIVKSLAKLSLKFLERRARRELYAKVVALLLEKCFDPTLASKMTVKEIRDTFVACGLPREQITPEQIELVYVKVLEKLTAGTLRDFIFKEGLHEYVHLKIEEITYSRQDWELNGR